MEFTYDYLEMNDHFLKYASVITIDFEKSQYALECLDPIFKDVYGITYKLIKDSIIKVTDVTDPEVTIRYCYNITGLVEIRRKNQIHLSIHIYRNIIGKVSFHLENIEDDVLKNNIVIYIMSNMEKITRIEINNYTKLKK